VPSTTIDFPPFQLDLRAGQLTRDGTPIPLRPKSFAVLRHLAERPGELLTKQQLLDAVWGDVAITEDVVRLSAGEVRAALGDDRAAPRFIETVPRRGYRFVAKMAAPLAIDERLAADDWLVGRERERAEISAWLEAARGGHRRIGFIAGEAGIGKTTLVDLALRDLERMHGTELRVARGQCVEHYGSGAPYLPVLEAIAALRRGVDGPDIDATLRHHAPSWLLRATGSSPTTAEDTPAPAADTQEHTLQRLAASLRAIAERTPLVLVLEDVHWSDYSTLDLLSVLAQRRETARLLVLCTLRPADAIARGHPVSSVARELLRKGLCQEIALGGLTEAELGRYLAARFSAATLPPELLPLMVERSEGNPFLAVVLVDHLIANGLLVDTDAGWELRDRDAVQTTIPDGLRAIIEPRLECLTDDERRVLEAASVAGPEFAAHAVAAVAPTGDPLADVEVVEQLCDGLARRQDILRECGEVVWPDGTTSARYAFRHALYQQVIDRRLTSSLRRRLHQKIGERLEAGYAGRTQEVASILAAHFDLSRDVERAIRYHGEAAGQAGLRVAYQEIRVHLRAALDLLQSQAESPDRLRREIPLLLELGQTLVSIHSWGDQEAFAAFTRARAIAERLEIPSMRLRALATLSSVHTMRADYANARVLAEEAFSLARQLGDDAAAGASQVDLAATLIHQGELQKAHECAERARSFFADGSMQDVFCRTLLVSTYAFSGEIARSYEIARETMLRAEKLGSHYMRAHVLTFVSTVCQVLHDVERARALATEAVRLTSEWGFTALGTIASMVLGWCDVAAGRADEGRRAVQDGFLKFSSSGQRTSTTSYRLLLVEAHLACGDVAAASETLERASEFLVETGERIYEVEIHRLRGECAERSGLRARAVEHFERAMSIAAGRGEPLFELRAATSLLRLGENRAPERVARLVERFGAGNDCADAQAARALLRARAAAGRTGRRTTTTPTNETSR